MAFGPGATVATVVEPETHVPAVNVPENPASLAVKDCVPVNDVNDSEAGDSTMGAGVGVGGGGVETTTP